MISKQHTIWCDRCAQWDMASSNTEREMRNIARKSGWKRIRDGKSHIDLCPECVKFKNGAPEK